MKTNKIIISLSVFVILISGCKKDWDEHYNTPPETINKNIWEVIKADPDLSAFVQYMEALKFDTLFVSGNTYSLFIPNNEAFDEFLATDTVTAAVLNYHISRHFIQSVNIKGSDKVRMIAEKFVVIQHFNNTTIFDGIPLEFESPLFLNGKYFIMSKVAIPKPNLFEYFEETNPVLKNYILGLDSIILDKTRSRPIGFDEFGRTVYDTVSEIYNEFEDFYFPVREEFRNKTATMVFPKSEDYNAALDIMAGTMGEVYQDYRDIPIDWQNDVLIPYLLEHGVFENSLSEVNFIKTGGPRDTLKLKNILGDSIAIDYEVDDKFICSNGVAFNYKNFVVPDTLFNGAIRIEGEMFIKKIGTNRFTWRDRYVKEISSQKFEPKGDIIPKASNDSIVSVRFTSGYTGSYSLELKINNIFPRKYLMVVRTNKNFGGVYKVYLNDELIREMDYYDYYKTDWRWYYYSVAGGRYFEESQGYHYWDAWAINEKPYGEAKLRFEYQGPSAIVLNAGLLIDYIDFIPYD
ncbi:MAG: fasciclin domain-containing protein [Bacteroidales bacterium]